MRRRELKLKWCFGAVTTSPVDNSSILPANETQRFRQPAFSPPGEQHPGILGGSRQDANETRDICLIDSVLVKRLNVSRLCEVIAYFTSILFRKQIVKRGFVSFDPKLPILRGIPSP